MAPDIPKEQTVFRLKPGYKSPDDLTSNKESVPSVTKYEVLIRIRGITLNYRDYAITVGGYPFTLKDNLVPFSDGAGDVVAVGEGVKDLQVGDKALGTFDITHQYGPQKSWDWGQGGPIDGTGREYIVLPESAVIKVPKESPQSYLEWASLVCTGATAWNALYGNNPLIAGQTVLLTGTGGVSLTALQFAKTAGATTIITSSSDEKLKYVKDKFGATHTINYKTTPNWGEAARKLTPGGKGVDHLIENGGSGTIEQSVAATKRGGVISVIGFLSLAEQSKMPDVTQLVLGSGVVMRGINVGSRQLLEDCVQLVVEKELRLPIEKEFGFTRDEIVEAYKYLGSGQHIGKVGINV